MRKILPFTLFFVFVVLSSRSEGQIYTYADSYGGCTCYGPGIDLNECATVLNWAGLSGIRIQVFQPRPGNGCGSRFIFFPDTFFRVQFRHCCNEYDREDDICDKSKEGADSELGGCISLQCERLQGSGAAYRSCRRVASWYQKAVEIRGQPAWYRAQSEMCMCSPCGYTGDDCWF